MGHGEALADFGAAAAFFGRRPFVPFCFINTDAQSPTFGQEVCPSPVLAASSGGQFTEPVFSFDVADALAFVAAHTPPPLAAIPSAPPPPVPPPPLIAFTEVSPMPLPADSATPTGTGPGLQPTGFAAGLGASIRAGLARAAASGQLTAPALQALATATAAARRGTIAPLTAQQFSAVTGISGPPVAPIVGPGSPTQQVDATLIGDFSGLPVPTGGGVAPPPFTPIPGGTPFLANGGGTPFVPVAFGGQDFGTPGLDFPVLGQGDQLAPRNIPGLTGIPGMRTASGRLKHLFFVPKPDGSLTYFRHVGKPLLFSRELSAVKRVERVARRTQRRRR